MHLRQNIFDPLRFSSRKTRSGIPEAVQLPAYRERPRVISFQGACVGVIRKALLVSWMVGAMVAALMVAAIIFKSASPRPP